MYFKRLEMSGFKSFADKTVLEFGDGITAVVGPNGSGKSNISDAIRWVLGEQSAKSLRGGKMEDVIFAGTDNRKPVGYAEVSIVMDNSDGSLNVDYAEVKVTRRLFRSGESEYLINGNTCRLKDINLMFADTGIGKDGYSMIGQGKVDEILSTKSEERRGIFEEASGIMKYRMRKEESERKLAAAEQNLVRIDDIIAELETQIATLKRQSATAKQYLQYHDELMGIEIGVLVDGIVKAEEKLTEIKENYENVQTQISNGEQESEKIKEENREKTELSEALGARYNSAKELAFEQEKANQKLTADIAMDRQKVSSLDADIKRMETDIGEREGHKDMQQKRILELETEDRELRLELAGIEAELSKAQRGLDVVLKAITGGNEKVAEKNRLMMEKKLEAGKQQSTAETLGGQLALYGNRISELEAELFKIGNDTKEAKETADRLDEEFGKAANALDDANANLEAADKTIKDCEKAIDEDTARLSDINTAINSAEAQLKLLVDMEQNFEGYAKSVKEILTLCRDNPKFGDGIHGAVAQIIKVGKEEELAIETALGNTYQDIVTETEEDAKLAIEYLRDNKLGRATFLPISAVNGKPMERDVVNQLKGTIGFVGIASELVEYDSKFDNIICSLLGRVAVFEDLDRAIFASRRFKYNFTSVTLQGDILRTSGAITGGSPEKGKRGGALSRTREIPELKALIANGRKKAGVLTSNLDKLKSDLREEEENRSKLAAEIVTLEKNAAALGVELKNAIKLKETAEAREKAITDDLAAQKEGLSAADSSILAARENAQVLLAEANALEAELHTIEADARQLNDERERRQNAITSIRINESSVNGRLSHISEEKSRIESEMEYSAEYSSNMRTQIDEAKIAKAEIEEEITQLESKLETGKLDYEKSSRACLDLFDQKKAVDDELKGMLERLSSIADSTGLLREEAGRLEVRRMRAEHDSEYNKTRLWEEYELTFTKAFEMTGGATPENLEEAKKRIAELRTAIKKLGAVNVESIEALNETQERYDFLINQRKDVSDTKEKLDKVIEELTVVMKKQFREQFAVIRENFQVVYKELFGGGKADIVLSDESDILSSGIEINVQPPGKKLQNMMLLSGGERALTAIALLFGILRMRPTPFCMLDEIESALDDANVYRFAQYAREFSNNTQLIMITHRKGTMEAADALYGVTMEEKGVSRVLSLRL